jgi:mono/diheme cytochrome c family protein
MRRAVLALSVLLGGAVFADDAGLVLNGDASKGKSTYRLMCFPCHGEKGAGNGPAAVALNPKPDSFADPVVAARMTPEWTYHIMKEGGVAHGKSKQMAPMSSALTETQLIDVTAYVMTLLPPAPKKK